MFKQCFPLVSTILLSSFLSGCAELNSNLMAEDSALQVLNGSNNGSDSEGESDTDSGIDVNPIVIATQELSSSILEEGICYQAGISVLEPSQSSGSNTSGIAHSNTFTKKTSFPEMRNIKSGQNHTIGLGSDKKLYTWTGSTPTIVDSPENVHFKYINTGYNYNFAISNEEPNQLYTWTATESALTKIVLPENEVPVLALGGEKHSVVLTKSNQVYTWGNNELGQLGNGTFRSSNTLVKVHFPTKDKIKLIRVGGNHSFILTENGKLYAWGDNRFGQLGLKNITIQNLPEKVSVKGSMVTNFYAGKNHSLAITKSNVFVWGDNQWGQLGFDPRSNEQVNNPTKFPHRLNFSHLETKFDHTIVLGMDGKIYGWGRNDNKQLGLGDTSENIIISPRKIKLIRR